MAAVNESPQSPLTPVQHEGFGNFQSPTSPLSPSTAQSPPQFSDQQIDLHNASTKLPSPSNPLISELQTIAIRTTPLCPTCKGQKYQFTAYFHNPAIFPSPPHHLLAMIERSYALRDRLKSLLVTYAMRDIEQERVRGIEAEINSWASEVLYFTTHVLCSAAGFEVQVEALEEVKRWTLDVSGRLVGHVRGGDRLEMGTGRLAELLAEFRRAWEGVWRDYLRDQEVAEIQVPNGIGGL